MRRVADDPGRLDLVGAPEGFDALVMADVVRARKGLSVFVARDGARISAFTDAFRFFGPLGGDRGPADDHPVAAGRRHGREDPGPAGHLGSGPGAAGSAPRLGEKG